MTPLYSQADAYFDDRECCTEYSGLVEETCHETHSEASVLEAVQKMSPQEANDWLFHSDHYGWQHADLALAHLIRSQHPMGRRRFITNEPGEHTIAWFEREGLTEENYDDLFTAIMTMDFERKEAALLFLLDAGHPQRATHLSVSAWIEAAEFGARSSYEVADAVVAHPLAARLALEDLGISENADAVPDAHAAARKRLAELDEEVDQTARRMLFAGWRLPTDRNTDGLERLYGDAKPLWAEEVAQASALAEKLRDLHAQDREDRLHPTPLELTPAEQDLIVTQRQRARLEEMQLLREDIKRTLRLTRHGFLVDGLHPETGTAFSPEGYDCNNRNTSGRIRDFDPRKPDFAPLLVQTPDRKGKVRKYQVGSDAWLRRAHKNLLRFITSGFAPESINLITAHALVEIGATWSHQGYAPFAGVYFHNSENQHHNGQVLVRHLQELLADDGDPFKSELRLAQMKAFGKFANHHGRREPITVKTPSDLRAVLGELVTNYGYLDAAYTAQRRFKELQERDRLIREYGTGRDAGDWNIYLTPDFRFLVKTVTTTPTNYERAPQ